MDNLEIIQKQLPLPIESSITIGDMTIVLVEDGKGRERYDTSLNRNVYAFDANGEMVWQIAEIPGAMNQCCPYGTITVKDGNLYTYNLTGMDYLVDLKDGSIHFFGPARRPW